MTHTQQGPTTPRSKRDPRGTRDRLVRAAIDLFTSQGYHQSTTPQIAARAGVAEGTIYRHFESKQHLLNEIYRATVRLLIAQVAGASASQPCRERLKHVAEAWRDLAIHDPGPVRLALLTQLDPMLDAKSRDTFRQLKLAIGNVIASGKAAGEVRAGSVEVWRDVWLGLVILVLDRVANGEWPETHGASEQVLRAAWDAISE